MAITFSSIHVFSDESVAADDFSLTSYSEGWQTLIPTEENRSLLSNPEMSLKAARRISKAVDKPVLWFFLYDEDYISFMILCGGKKAASFTSDFQTNKHLTDIPALIGREESYRKRLGKILRCTDTEELIQLLEEYFGVCLLIYPELLEDEPDSVVKRRGDAAFQKYAEANHAPSGKKAPVQCEQIFEMEGVLSDGDWEHEYYPETGLLGIFKPHYWLYAEQKMTGIEKHPVHFSDGKLRFISREEMRAQGADAYYNETRNENPFYTQEFFPSRLCFAHDAPAPYAGKTLLLPHGFYGLGFDGKNRVLLTDEQKTFAVMSGEGRLTAKQNVKGNILDQDGDYILTFEEAWGHQQTTAKVREESVDIQIIKWSGVIRIYKIFDL